VHAALGRQQGYIIRMVGHVPIAKRFTYDRVGATEEIADNLRRFVLQRPISFAYNRPGRDDPRDKPADVTGNRELAITGNA
jgi:hypothetical protein